MRSDTERAADDIGLCCRGVRPAPSPASYSVRRRAAAIAAAEAAAGSVKDPGKLLALLTRCERDARGLATLLQFLRQSIELERARIAR